MLKKILLALMFAITAITNVAHAEDDMKTVASKAYVDTKIETKQLKIPAANQPNVGAGETVMTYTATGNGQIGERGLYSDISSYDASTDGDKLITASALNATFTNLPTTPTTKLECANQADGCTLWTIVDQTAYARGLPDGYTRLEYIQSTGTQYIDTGVKGNMGYKYDIDFQQLDAGRYRNWGAFNQQTYNGGPNMSLTYATGFAVRWTVSGVAEQLINQMSAVDTNRHHLVIDNGYVTWDGVAKGRSSGHQDNYGLRYNLFLGTVNPGGTTPTVNAKSKYYSYKVWNGNGDLIQNFVPAKNSSGVIGMYDTVSGNFFTNAATSGDDFTPGPPAN